MHDGLLPLSGSGVIYLDQSNRDSDNVRAPQSVHHVGKINTRFENIGIFWKFRVN